LEKFGRIGVTDAEVQKVIRRKVDESVESAVLRKELINLALLNIQKGGSGFEL
jgi:hypothetical protein